MTDSITETQVERLKAAVAAFYAEHGRVPSVIFDSDEVIYPFWETFVPFHNRRHPHLPDVVGPFTNYDMRHGRTVEEGDALIDSLNNLDWSILRPHPQAIPALAALINAGIDVSVATSHLVGNVYQPSAKVYQFHRDFNGHLDKRLVITQDKTRVLGDWLVDDKPEITGALPAQWQQIVFTQEYNLDVEGPRATWDTIIDVLIDLIEGRLTEYTATSAAPVEAAVPVVSAPVEVIAEPTPVVSPPVDVLPATEATPVEDAVLPWMTTPAEAAEPVTEVVPVAPAADWPPAEPGSWDETPAAGTSVPPVKMPWDTDEATTPTPATESFGNISWDAIVSGEGDKK